VSLSETPNPSPISKEYIGKTLFFSDKPQTMGSQYTDFGQALYYAGGTTPQLA
jgi:hypothetical protein